MDKLVKIGNNSYHMRSSLYTPYKYRQDTGKDLLEEIKVLNPKEAKVEMMEMVYKVIDIAYVMMAEYSNYYHEKMVTKEEWLMNIDNILEDTDWIYDVLTLAMYPFRRTN